MVERTKKELEDEETNVYIDKGDPQQQPPAVVVVAHEQIINDEADCFTETPVQTDGRADGLTDDLRTLTEKDIRTSKTSGKQKSSGKKHN